MTEGEKIIPIKTKTIANKNAADANSPNQRPDQIVLLFTGATAVPIKRFSSMSFAIELQPIQITPTQKIVNTPIGSQ